MSVARLLKEVGRPVAYYPKLALMLDSVNAAVFLCQFLYWSDKGSDPDGWIYKKQSEIEEETGLTRRRQESVRKRLRDMGLLDEERRGTHGTLHFRVNSARLDALWSEWLKAPMAESDIDESSRGTEQPNANGADRHSLNKDAEITPETTEREVARERASFLPDWLPPKLWARWVSHLTQKGKKVTVEMLQAHIEKLGGMRARGMPVEEVINQSIDGGWVRFFELDRKAGGNGNGQAATQPRTSYGGKPPVTRDFSKYPSRAG